MKISGICSSHTEDSDGEFLDPTGFDFAPLIEKGFFNWNHQANKDASAILGRPTAAQVINDGKDFHVEGYLYKGSEQAKAVYNLAQVLEEEDPTRRLGFSIEGQALERDPINKKRVRRARITGIAITHCPKNANTLLSIMKGEYSEPFVEEEVDSSDIQTWVQQYENWATDNGNGSKGDWYGKEGSVLEFLQNNHEDHLSKKDELIQAINKAMTVNTDINPESVEGKPKSLVDSDKVNFLTKSDIYNKILDTYPNIEIEKAKEIYKLAEQTAEKLFNMKTGQITDDTLSKAFSILESASLQKSESSEESDTTTTTTTEEPVVEKSEEENEMEKSLAMESLAKSYLEKGMNRGEALDEMQKGGFSLTECESCIDKVIREFQANKDGGNLEVIAKSLEETLSNRIEKSELGTSEMISTLAKGLDEKFGAISEILKSQTEGNLTQTGKVDSIEKSLTGLSEMITKIADQPLERKSVTNIAQVERFEKSLSGKTSGVAYELSKPEDRNFIADKLLAKAQEFQQLGRPSSVIETAISDLEITKSLSNEAVALLSNMGVEVVK